MSSSFGIDSTLLSDFYAARYGLATSTGAATATPTAAKTAPTAPWSAAGETAKVSALTRSALNGGRFIDPDAAKLDAPAKATSSSDYKNLFALYQGLSALGGIAQQASFAGVSASQTATLQARFAAGLSEVQGFLATKPFSAFGVADGTAGASLSSTVGVGAEVDSYVGAAVSGSDPAAAVTGLDPDAKFSLTVARPHGAPVQVDFDLSDLGSAPRTLSAVTDYLNGKLADAAVATRFSIQTTQGAEKTAQVNGKTVNLGVTAPDQYSLKIKGVSGENLSFSAPAATPAVYLSQTSGLTTGTSPDAVQQLLKFDPAAGADASDRTFARTLPAGLGTVRATATGPDGSVYLLADVTGATTGGQAPKGAQDVALVKYDSAGQLGFVQTLGAANTATGFALAVSPDGAQVAVAGTVTGDLDAGDAAGAKDATGFLQVFGANGDALWDVRGGAAGQQPRAVAFQADGSVLVSGATNADGAASLRGGYLTSYTPTAHVAADGTDLGATVHAASAAGVSGPGGATPAGVVALPGGGVATAAVENGHAVLRLYAGPLTADAQPTAVRDLGDLGGGSLAGLALNADGSLVVAGTSGSGALSAGQTTTGYTSGKQAFVAKVSADLQPSGDERLSYLDLGAGASASAIAVSGGQAYITGQVTPDGADGAHVGFVAALDPDSGAVSWSDRITGLDNQDAPTGIAVDPRGSSALDALGLPTGAISYAPSTLVTTATSARAGDTLTIQSGSGPAVKVTLAADDTLKTLAAKINKASGYSAAATVATLDGRQQLTLAPAGATTSVTLGAGAVGSDLLAALGLNAGVVQKGQTAKSKTTSIQATPYALNLGTALNLTTAAGAKAAQGALTAALATVRKIYTDLSTPPQTSAAAKAAGASSSVSAYTQARIADYQLALSRLAGAS